MKLVVDIDDTLYKAIRDCESPQILSHVAIKNGIPYEERPHGEWVGDTDLDGTCKCSTCRMTFDIDRLKMAMCDGKYEMPPCCPNCGSDNRPKEGEASAKDPGNR